MATIPEHVTATREDPPFATSRPVGPPQQGQALPEMVAVRQPQYGSGVQGDHPPRYNQVMGVEPPLYNEAVSPPPYAGLQSPDPLLQERDKRLSLNRICGAVFRALGQCNLVLLTVLCLAVFVIVTLALDSPYGQLPRQKQRIPLQPHQASSFKFIRNNQTHKVQAEMSGCGSSVMPIEINHFSWSPSTVHLGGFAVLDLSAVLSESIDAPIKLEVKVERRVIPFLWVDVPCLDGFGSCSYEDVCRLLPTVPGGTPCPQVLPHAKLPCRCPVTQGNYFINHDRVLLPDVSVIPSWLKKGRYRVRARAIAPATGRQMGCIKLKVTVV